MKIVVMNSILYVFMLMIINMLIVGDFCFQAQASVKRCLQLSVYRKMELNKKD